jgi:hypothetical protein
MVPPLADQFKVTGSSSGSATTAVMVVLPPATTCGGFAVIPEITGDRFAFCGGGGGGGAAAGAAQAPKIAAITRISAVVSRRPLDFLIANHTPFLFFVFRLLSYLV